MDKDELQLNPDVSGTDFSFSKKSDLQPIGLSSNGTGVEDPNNEYQIMETLALDAPLQFMAKYNSPREWILDQREASKARVAFAPGDLSTRTSVAEKVAFGVGNVAYDIAQVPARGLQTIGDVGISIEKTFFPNMSDSALSRGYNALNDFNQRNDTERQQLVSVATGDSAITSWSQTLADAASWLLPVTRAAKVASAGVKATAVARGIPVSRALGMAGKAAKKAAGRTVVGTSLARGVGATSVESARQYMESTGAVTLNDYDPRLDLGVNIVTNLINANIEKSLGFDAIIPHLYGSKYALLKGVAENIAKGVVGEASEEWFQEGVTEIGEMVRGYREWWNFDLDRMAHNAVVGGVVGGAFGGGLYYLNRRAMIRNLEKQGLTGEDATEFVDSVLTDGIEKTMNNLSSQLELKNQKGQAWDKLVKGAQTAMESVGFGDEQTRNAQAKTWAQTNTNIAIRQALESGLNIDEFLDIAEFQSVNNGNNLNMLFLKPLGTIADIDARIKEKDAIINREKELKKTGAGDNTILANARRQKAILEKAKFIKTLETEQYKDQIKAQTTPELAKEIETAGNDVETVKGATQAEFDAKADTQNLTSAEKTKRYGNAVLKSILPTKTAFDAVMVDPVYANAKQAIIAVADRINSFIKAHRNSGLKTDIANALKKMQTINQGNFIDSVTTPDLDGVDVIAENAFLYHFLFSDATTIQTYLDSYITRAEESLNSKNKLSKKDLVGQSFKATDNAMQTQAQVIGAEYTSIYNEDGSYADKNVMAVMLSYQNQFVQEQGQNIPPQMLEQFDLADENARLDDIYPAYDGETIEVDGKERTVYNSNGDRIAKSAEALTNFWRWFGDSKVVDEQGRPIVMYHGTNAVFDEFDARFIKSSTGRADLGYGYYFSSEKTGSGDSSADWYGNIIMPVYLKSEKPFIVPENDSYGIELGKKLLSIDPNIKTKMGEKISERVEKNKQILMRDISPSDILNLLLENKYDGVISGSEYVVHYSNQIKSVDNRGTYDSRTPNIYYQAAYAGSRVDYDQPSLEAIGSGEGAQAHGWGLYYALNPVIAEQYRAKLTAGISSVEYDGKTYTEKDGFQYQTLKYLANSNLGFDESKQIILRNLNNDINNGWIGKDLGNLVYKKFVDSITPEKIKSAKVNQNIGQVHEVDIPEMDVLLDEQKMLIDQSEFVQKKIWEINDKLNLGIKDSGIRGGEIYQRIANAMDEFILDEDGNVKEYNDIFKQASQYLDKEGIKGITYDGRQDGRCFVIFNPESVKVLRKKFDELGNQLFQGRKANGFYDPELGVIVLGRNMNEMTLPHEMQHYWLDKIFSIYKRAKSGELKVRDEWMTETKALFNMLGIDETQPQLTQGQQEKFARMSEAYLTGIGVGDMNATFKEYQQWIPEKYKSMMNLAYQDDEGKIVMPYLDQAAVDFFNKWYANYSLPSLATSPERQEFVNPEYANGEVQTVSIKEMNNRNKEFGVDAEEQVHTDERLYNTLDENMPAEIKVEADGQRVVQASRSNFLKESEKQQRRWFERKSRDTEAQLAQDYIEKNPEHAKEVIYGDPELIPNDTGIDRATLINAYMALNNITPENEDWATLHTNIAINQSLAGTQLALSNNTSYQPYLDALREIEKAREIKAATNYAGAKQGALERFNRDIQRFVDEELPKVLATAPNSEERSIALKSLFERARTKFSGNTTGSVLNQMDIDYAKAQKKGSAAFTRWAVKQIKKDAGAKLNGQEQAKLLEISAKAQQATIDLDNRNIGIAVAGAQEIRKWQVEKDKLAGVNPQKFSWMGDFAPRAMLASFNTLVVANIPSTAMNTAVVRMLERGVFGENKVSADLTDSEIKRIKAVYGATAMNLAQMEKPTSPSLLHGEKYSSSGQKWYDPFTILGKEDNWFRVPTFVNTLARLATQDAKATGRNADEVFKEYCRLENQSDEAKLARKQALAVANMAVFTQDGGLARALNGIRDWINKGSRVLIGLEPEGFGLGNLLSPFLKTGANIAEMGIRGSIAPITTIAALVQSWHTGKAIDPMKKLALAMDWSYFTLSSVAVALLAALTSDDDDFYSEPYQMGRKYDPNKPYDSINIAGVWISLDFFGPFAIPMRTACRLIQQWKTDNLSAIYKAYGQGAKYAAMDTPLLETIFNNQMGYATKKPEDWATGWAYNQANKLIPAQIKPLSRAISRGAGWQLDTGYKIIDRKFHRNYGFDAAELTTQDLIDIFSTKFTYQP